MKKQQAFTLAEVLITLAIIGVIAAISVPSLIQKTNQAELITAWKKEFAVLSQAAGKYAFDVGTIPKYSNAMSYSNEFVNYIKIIKTCPNDTDGNCWHSNGNWTNLTGSVISGITANAGRTTAIVSDGSLMRFDTVSGFNCVATPDYTKSSDGCVWVEFDINGFKKPNAIGKDIFGTVLYSDGVVGPLSSTMAAAWDCTTDGWGCSAEYLYQNKK